MNAKTNIVGGVRRVRVYRRHFKGKCDRTARRPMPLLKKLAPVKSPAGFSHEVNRKLRGNNARLFHCHSLLTSYITRTAFAYAGKNNDRLELPALIWEL